MSIPLVASSPLIYQLSFAAGRELEEEQLAERMSLVLYLGWLPLIMGPSSGKSEITFNFIYESIGGLFLPTTYKKFSFFAVWNRGASPDTSHKYIPSLLRSTLLRTILVSDDWYS